MKPKYVYLMLRISDDKAILIKSLLFQNAKRIEYKLQKKFDKINVILESSETIYYHIKIGISSNPLDRLDQVNKSKLEDGWTEWRRLNWLERIVLDVYFYLYWLLPYFYKYLFISITMYLTVYLLIKKWH